MSLARLSLALAGLTLACMPSRQLLSRRPEPSAQVLSIRTEAFDRQRADLVLEIAVENPGADLALSAADYEILAQGRSFATGTAALSLRVPRGGRASLSLPIGLAYLDLPWAARLRYRQGEPVQLVARGALRGRAGVEALTVEFDGETEVLPDAADALPPGPGAQ